MNIARSLRRGNLVIVGPIIAGLTMIFNIFSVHAQTPVTELPDSIAVSAPGLRAGAEVVLDSIDTDADDQWLITPIDTVAVDVPARPLDLSALTHNPFENFNEWEARPIEFNPDPTRAVWMSALFPGLGQLYNRRYWKLPIVAGAYLGLGYATSWNNNMLTDYSQAYRDLLDDDPDTRSYMDFFPPTVDENSLDKSWLKNLFKSRKDYFRRNRDLCIICMVGVYFLAMVDAYVDASLSHFDISDQLSMDVAPAMLQDSRSRWPSVGIIWAINF